VDAAAPAAAGKAQRVEAHVVLARARAAGRARVPGDRALRVGGGGEGGGGRSEGGGAHEVRFHRGRVPWTALEPLGEEVQRAAGRVVVDAPEARVAERLVEAAGLEVKGVHVRADAADLAGLVLEDLDQPPPEALA